MERTKDEDKHFGPYGATDVHNMGRNRQLVEPSIPPDTRSGNARLFDCAGGHVDGVLDLPSGEVAIVVNGTWLVARCVRVLSDYQARELADQLNRVGYREAQSAATLDRVSETVRESRGLRTREGTPDESPGFIRDSTLGEEGRLDSRTRNHRAGLADKIKAQTAGDPL